MTEERPIANPTRTKEILEAHGFSFKKSLGQNFITEINILEKIVETADLSEKDAVVEVGPGIGALTEQIAKRAGKVLAFEIDDRLLPVLAETLAPYPNVKVLHQDVLTANLNEIIPANLGEETAIKVVANLPYYITTPIMMQFITSDVPVDTMVLMMQKEVADRLSAAPNSKAYGSLSIAVQYLMDVKIAFTVPKTVFVPQPNVDSAIIKLTKKTTPPVNVQDEAYFFKVVRGAFVQRRKTLWNNMLQLFGKTEEVKEKLQAALDEAEISPQRRGESLSIEEFAILSNKLYPKLSL